MVWSVQGDENKKKEKKKNIFTHVSVIEQNIGTLQNQLKYNRYAQQHDFTDKWVQKNEDK